MLDIMNNMLKERNGVYKVGTKDLRDKNRRVRRTFDQS
jgi:hypothetical protein